MPRWRRWSRQAEDDGSAAVEFVTAGMLLIVPLVYLSIALGSVQGAALAAEGAARQAARVYVQAPDDATASERAERAVAFALHDYGVPRSAARVAVACTPDPGECLHRTATVTVTVRVDAPLPLVPDVLDLSRRASVPVEASAAQTVSRLWGFE